MKSAAGDVDGSLLVTDLVFFFFSVFPSVFDPSSTAHLPLLHPELLLQIR